MKTRAGRAARTAKVSPVMKGGMPRALGGRILSLTRNKVIGELPIKPMHLNETGKVNGGAIMAFADVLGAAGAVANRRRGMRRNDRSDQLFAAGKGRCSPFRFRAHQPHHDCMADDDQNRRACGLIVTRPDHDPEE